MQQYLEIANLVLQRGRRRSSSAQGIGNFVYPGYEFRLNPRVSFPLLTTKSLLGSWRGIVAELLWFLSGSSRVADLHKVGVHFWDQWATKQICDRYGLPEGDLGRIYGPQWRSWLKRDGGHIDQISDVINEVKTNPDSKRMMVTSWNPEDVDGVMIAPCHGIFKFVVADGVLDMCGFQRSADLPVGVPFNLASYSLLLMMVAQVTGLCAGTLSHYIADIHVYDNQMDGIREQLSRNARLLPEVQLNPKVTNIFDFTVNDFVLVHYNPHPYIKIPVAL